MARRRKKGGRNKRIRRYSVARGGVRLQIMNKPLINHNLNCYKSETKQLEKNTLPSLTQPDLSLTVRQIISRARQGLIDPIQKPNTFYSGTMPDLKGLDLVELQELQQRADSMEKELQIKVDDTRRRYKRDTVSESSVSTQTDPGYRDWKTDRKSTRLNSSHRSLSRMPSSA